VAGSEQGDDWRTLNRANWDDRTRVHVASKFYDLDAFRAGADSLRPFEPGEAGDVTGKRLIHLQCHIGLDTLSWARRGALVSGLDFSQPAIAAAASLAAELGIDARFAVADVYDAAAAFPAQRFDIVYTGVGALVWLPDIPRWAQVAASLLAPGGFLYLVEGHPFAEILDDRSGTTVARDYFDSAPQVEDFERTYTDGPPLEHTRSVQFQHRLGQVITALADIGLRIEFVHEYDYDCWQRYESLRRDDAGLYWQPPGQPRVPLMYSLRASRPG
jgi:SAM-dependent methyltransferase